MKTGTRRRLHARHALEIDRVTLVAPGNSDITNPLPISEHRSLAALKAEPELIFTDCGSGAAGTGRTGENTPVLSLPSSVTSGYVLTK